MPGMDSGVNVNDPTVIAAFKAALLWVFDGILQAQPKMAIGLPSQVIEPSAAAPCQEQTRN